MQSPNTPIKLDAAYKAILSLSDSVTMMLIPAYCSNNIMPIPAIPNSRNKMINDNGKKVCELERSFIVMRYIVCITKESNRILKKIILILFNIEAIKYRQVVIAR